MASIEIDDSRWPLVTARFEGTATDAEFDAYLARMGELITRGKVMCLILDARAAGSTPAIQRRKQADWMKRYERELRTQSAGTAFVITSAIVRGALTAILWVQPIPNEHTVVATIEEAERWALAQLAKRGARVPGR